MNKGFKPLLVEFQEEQFNLDKANKANKVECLLSIKDWILKYIGDVDLDLKKLTNDFVGYFLDIVAKRFVKENTLGLSASKLVELKGYPMYEFQALVKKYSENTASIDITKDKATYKMKRKDYETYTKTDRENTLLCLYKEWILLDKKTRDIGLNPQLIALQSASAGLVNVAFNGKHHINKEILFNK